MTAVAPGACHDFDVAGADRLLSRGEQLVFELRAHGKALIGPAIILVGVSSAASFIAATIPGGAGQAPLRLIIAAAALGVVLRWALWPFLRWYTTTYVLTTRRLVIRQGVLARQGHDVPLWRVSDVSFTRSLGQRVLGCGTLVIETSGAQQPIVVVDLPLVEQVQREVYRLTDDDRTRRAVETAGAPAVPDIGSGRDGT